MNFYNVFIKLCAEKGVSASSVAQNIGLSRASAAGWKTGALPSDVNMQKIANYFDVSVEYLRGETDQKKKPLVNNDEELTEAESLLLELFRGVPVESQQMMLEMIKIALKNQQ